MKIGYCVQGDADEAFIRGLAARWCPGVSLIQGVFRGASQETLKRKIAKSLVELRDSKRCDLVVYLTDADREPWRDVKNREFAKIPEDRRHLTIFGVADRNIECWLAIDRSSLARELDCYEQEIPRDAPSDFVKQRFGLSGRDKELGKTRVRNFVKQAQLKTWIERSDSFEDFYEDARDWALQNNCSLPNERERQG